MTNVEEVLQRKPNPEELAQAFLKDYFGKKQAAYPINPFIMLADAGVPFVFRPFKNYEGVYIPSDTEDDIPVVGINLKRPITRQRYTAAHELCHHIKDKNTCICPTYARSSIEWYAETFAAELLMPVGELKKQANKYKKNGYVSLDDVLQIAYYFGVSFKSCLNRLAYKIHCIEGDTSPRALRKSAEKYHPDNQRADRGLDNIYLYEDLFLAIKPNLVITSSDNVRHKFENEYVYNDSRLEGIDLEIGPVSEITTDIRLNRKDSEFCTSEFKEIVEVAGHAVMYSYVFSIASKEKISVFDSITLNSKLFSCTPYPEYSGKTRETNTLVLGAKFETVDHKDIVNELLILEKDVQHLEENLSVMSLTEYIERVVRLHHRMTVIHPFPDGNGRTSRAFMNLLFIRNGIPPIYLKIEDKEEYLHALHIADNTGDYNPLYEVFFKAILRAHAELTSFPEL